LSFRLLARSALLLGRMGCELLCADPALCVCMTCVPVRSSNAYGPADDTTGASGSTLCTSSCVSGTSLA
jgi:hypothetical protein